MWGENGWAEWMDAVGGSREICCHERHLEQLHVYVKAVVSVRGSVGVPLTTDLEWLSWLA